MTHYALLDHVKNKLRFTDTDERMNEELEFYLSDIDNYCNRKLRNLFGRLDHQGRDIELPLTEDSNPSIDSDLISRAVDLVVGLYRKQQNNEEKLWENAVKDFDDYLVERFGWARDRPMRFTTPPVLVVQGPIPNVKLADGTVKDLSRYVGEGELITVNGNNFSDFKKLTVTFSGKGDFSDPDPLVTVPDQVTPGWFSDELGNFAGNQIQVPVDISGDDENKIRVEDGTQTTNNFADIRVFVLPKIVDSYLVDAVIV